MKPNTSTWRGCLAVMMAVATLAACQSAPPATPTAAATAPAATAQATTAPSPSAAAVDVVPQFVTAMKRLASGGVSIDGSATVGNIKVTIVGTSTFDGPDSEATMTTTVGGVSTVVQTIQVAGQAYSKAGDGPWLPSVRPQGKDLANSLKDSAASTFTDKGTQTRAGKVVHELVASSGSAFDPSVFLASATGVSNPAGSTTFYCTEDGTPAGATIDLTWTQAAGSTRLDASMTFELTFSGLGTPQSIRAPEDVWQQFESKGHAFRVAYPPAYDHTTTKGYEYFIGPASSVFSASRAKTQGYTLNEIANGEASSLKAMLRTKIVTNTAIKMSGLKGRLLSTSGTNAKLGGKVIVYETIVVKGAYVYYLIWFSKPGNQAADLATFMQAVSTFVVES